MVVDVVIRKVRLLRHPQFGTAFIACLIGMVPVSVSAASLVPSEADCTFVCEFPGLVIDADSMPVLPDVMDNPFEEFDLQQDFIGDFRPPGTPEDLIGTSATVPDDTETDQQ